ncbi:MAG: glycosyltransferase [Bacteroidota bacterium]
MKKIFILLPVHNRKDITRRFITCLRQQTYQDFQLILIDDGSTDGTATMVQQTFPSVVILQGTGDWWWAGCLQQGFLWLKKQIFSKDDIVLLINDDSIFNSDYLQTGINLLEKSPHTLQISTVYSQHSHTLLDGGVHADWMRGKFSITLDPNQVNCASTRGLFLFATDFILLGGFYPHLIPHYASDYEFTVRAYRKGFRLQAHDTLVLYLDERSTGFQNLKQENSYRSFLKRLFSKKYMMQPVYHSFFFILACPWPWKITNVVILWLSTVWKIVKYFFLLIIFKGIRKNSQF